MVLGVVGRCWLGRQVVPEVGHMLVALALPFSSCKRRVVVRLIAGVTRFQLLVLQADYVVGVWWPSMWIVVRYLAGVPPPWRRIPR